MTRHGLLIFTLFLVACSCDHGNCRIDEIFLNKDTPEEERLRPWEKSTETVSGIKKKDEVRLKKNFLILDTQSLSTREIILKRKREEEKKALEMETK